MLTEATNYVLPFLTWVIPILIAITFHEAAHGLVAYRLGDDTAFRAGRLTLNPFRHIDPFGTVILPLILFLSQMPFLFGYAKPVPVDKYRLHNPRSGMFWVALAGPMMNILLFLLGIFCLKLLSYTQGVSGVFGEWLVGTIRNFIVLNLVLALFNLIPVPPLDGGRMLCSVLNIQPKQEYMSERYGILFILALLIVLPLLGYNIFAELFIVPLEYIYRFFIDLMF